MKPAAPFLYAPAAADISKPPERLRDSVLYILDRIYVRRAYWAEHSDPDYVPLHAATLRKVIPKYQEATAWMEQAGWITINPHYQPGKHSRGYKWLWPYDPVTLIPCPDSLALKIRKQKQQKTGKTKPVHQYLAHWWARLRIDYPEAEKHIRAMKDEEQNKGIYLATARLILNGQCELEPCQYGRLHSPLTRLPKCLRPYLYLEGMEGVPLIGVDVANCQPLLLCALLREKYPECFKDANPYTDPHPTLYDAHFAESPGKTGSFSSKNCGVSPNDEALLMFDRLCQEGTLYDTLLRYTTYRSRDELKERFFSQVLYGKRNGKRKEEGEGQLRMLFRTMFPPVFAFIDNAKRKNYRHLSHRIQKKESRLMIGKVCGRLMQECPHVPALTIHDCILTTPPHLETVKTLIGEAFAALGVKAALRNV